MPRIAPSLLAFDQLHLGAEVDELAAAGADMLHVDVMDGHFVDNLTFGLPLVAALKQQNLLLDVHLMVSNPAVVALQYAEAGADRVVFHVEASDNHAQTLTTLKALKAKDCKAGLAINPDTSLQCLAPYLEALDIINVMAVQAGRGGQTFIPATLERLKRLHALLLQRGVEVMVDGGINLNWSAKLVQAGADTLVIGTALATSTDRQRDMELFRQAGAIDA